MTERMVVAEPTLEEMAVEIRREHEAAEDAARTWLEHAVVAGDWLRRAYEQCELGKWQEWVEEVAGLSAARAHSYQRASLAYEELKNAGITSHRGAREYLKGRHYPELSRRRSLKAMSATTEALSEQAQQLKAAGLRYTEIAERLGVSATYARKLTLPPEIRNGQQRDYDRARHKRRVIARRERRNQKREREQQLALAQAPKAVSNLYAATEAFQDLLGAAHSVVQDPEARAELARMGEDYRRMRDRMPAILGILYREGGKDQ